MFSFTPLLGAQDSTSAASQSILELDGGIKILVDVGWTEDFDAGLLKELEKHVPTLSFILLTHATTAHLGAFAHCCKHIPLFTRIPVYATEPVIAFGRSLLQDIYSSTPLAASILSAASLQESLYAYTDQNSSISSSSILLQPPTQIEIAGYFSAIRSLKYSQPLEPVASTFSPPLNGLTITAYSAGRTLGGTIWHIQHGQESLVYAVDWSQARERVLSGAAWLDTADSTQVIESLRRPTALICSSRGSQRIALTGGQKKRDETLLALIHDTISRGGTVLIPSDSSARVMELVYMLESAWAQNTGKNDLHAAKLYFASAAGKTTMSNARRMLEWMDPNVQRDFENQAGHGRQSENKKATAAPFDFVHTKILERKKQVVRALSREGAKVIVGSDTSLEWGLSRVILENIAADDKNLIVLTESSTPISRSSRGTGKLLWDLWCQKAGITNFDAQSQDPPSQAFSAGGESISSTSAHLQSLSGNELAIYQQYLARQRQMQNTVNTEEITTTDVNLDVADARSESSSESEDEDDDQQQGKALNITATMSHAKNRLGLTDAELGIDVLIRRKGRYDYDIRGKKGRERMYPVPKKGLPKDDEYGDAIKPEDYLRAEERDENIEDEERGLSRKETGVGEKRKWVEVGKDATSNGRKLLNGNLKRRRPDEASIPMDGVQTNGNASSDDDDDDDDDDDLEARPEGPVKAVFTDLALTLALRLAFVDFSGYYDKRIMQYLIPKIQPRKLILIGGATDETLALAEDCKQLLALDQDNINDISMPTNGQTIDASVDTNAWTVKLSQPLYKKLRWQNVRGLGVVALSAFLLPAADLNEEADEDSKSKKLKLSNGEDKSTQNGTAILPLLDLFSTAIIGNASRNAVAQSIHVGDIRLADLRKSLQAEQYQAEFRGEGTLVINNSVAVRKSATGRLEVEGLLALNGYGRPDATFYATRRKVYDMLAVVSGA